MSRDNISPVRSTPVRNLIAACAGRVASRPKGQHSMRRLWVPLVFLAAIVLWPAGMQGAGPASVEAVVSYDDLLQRFVDEDGLVDYAGLKRERGKLDGYADYLARLDSGMYDGYDDSGKIAFWVNAYNALTLVAIIDNYPIEPSRLKSLVYPKQSIRQIPGVWDKLEFTVMGEAVTLNHIEHEILRKQFHEPRIHMALVCASIGCPLLRRETFSGAHLEQQLSDQTRRFLSVDRNFKIDRERGVVHLSSIFDWFAGDFEDAGKKVDFKQKHDKKRRAALQFVLEYLGVGDRKYIIGEKYDVAYLPYDWALNVQPETGERGGR